MPNPEGVILENNMKPFLQTNNLSLDFIAESGTFNALKSRRDEINIDSLPSHEFITPKG